MQRKDYSIQEEISINQFQETSSLAQGDYAGFTAPPAATRTWKSRRKGKKKREREDQRGYAQKADSGLISVSPW